MICLKLENIAQSWIKGFIMTNTNGESHAITVHFINTNASNIAIKYLPNFF